MLLGIKQNSLIKFKLDSAQVGNHEVVLNFGVECKI
ncbi:hypothetical protein cd3_080 [Carnobacterium phage cd3]|uniref:Uncharacterized protein n=1 Tax=Carnobacterium phage cd2 TaxID=2849244 RepID=A0AAE7VHP3_9CAUD|nr:hypothetical protein PQD68_gp080 [Carnobacterium phage cd2]QXP45206.1 hypothetical protein cd2_080 [Carnobacterium phage cd2]URQ01396.1 hypothetical protein cd3_080 [Carnobacterium phage cd3]